MDARAFFSKGHKCDPQFDEWLAAILKMLFGGLLVWRIAEMSRSALLTGWIGMVGFVFLLHFGFFHLLALTWQLLGINAQPIMRAPLRAKSLSEFWSVRWNRGFNQLVHEFALMPLHSALGIQWTVLGIFLISGVIHDFVISLPAGGGYGLPTLYFLIQGLGVLAQRSRRGKALGLNSGFRGRLFTVAFISGPVFILFHPPFIQNVILPFMKALQAI